MCTPVSYSVLRPWVARLWQSVGTVAIILLKYIFHTIILNIVYLYLLVHISKLQLFKLVQSVSETCHDGDMATDFPRYSSLWRH